MGMNPLELISYEKYIQSYIRQPIQGRRNIIGVFKQKKSGKIIKGDNFSCIMFGKCNAKDCYKRAVEYFNYTRQNNEDERIFVSAKWDKLKLV